MNKQAQVAKSKNKSKRISLYYNEPPNMYISLLLRNDAKKKAELAKEIGVSVEAVRLWTSGYTQPETSKLIKIADFFGHTIDYLFRGVDSHNITVANELGLSNKAIQLLKQTKTLSDSSQTPYLSLYFELLNHLITSLDLVSVADSIYSLQQIDDGKLKEFNAIIPTLTPEKIREGLLERTNTIFRNMIENFIKDKQKNRNKGDNK